MSWTKPKEWPTGDKVQLAASVYVRALVQRLRVMSDDIRICVVCGQDYGMDSFPVHDDACELAALERTLDR